MPGESGGPVVTTLVCLFFITHEAAGALSTRHSPRPQFSRANASRTTRAPIALRERGVIFEIGATSLRGATGPPSSTSEGGGDDAIQSSISGRRHRNSAEQQQPAGQQKGQRPDQVEVEPGATE